MRLFLLFCIDYRYIQPSTPYKDAGRWICRAIADPFVNIQNVFNIGVFDAKSAKGQDDPELALDVQEM
jgi:hypothetical protein